MKTYATLLFLLIMNTLYASFETFGLIDITGWFLLLTKVFPALGVKVMSLDEGDRLVAITTFEEPKGT